MRRGGSGSGQMGGSLEREEGGQGGGGGVYRGVDVLVSAHPAVLVRVPPQQPHVIVGPFADHLPVQRVPGQDLLLHSTGGNVIEVKEGIHVSTECDGV